MLIRKIKNYTISFSRISGVLQTIDKLRFCCSFLRTFGGNRRFKKRYPHLALPPFDVAWDAYGSLDWGTYMKKGQEAAETYSAIINRYIDSNKANRVLDWGCSAARVVRHMPRLVRGNVQWHGSDYNKVAIAWCKRNISGLEFITNELAPPIAFEDKFFDFVYCISVFTHLSEEMHFAWRNELLRILKDGGILILSANGDSHRNTKLLSHEKTTYDNGELVVKGQIQEGKKWYSAFHSPRFMRDNFFTGIEILEHITRRGRQDIWVVRKPQNNNPQGASLHSR